MNFDPDAPAAPGDGVFGLPHSREQARVVLLPVPFDATVSYGHGCAKGPGAIREASAQVDLLDHLFGKPWEAGIFMEEESVEVRDISVRARELAVPIVERGGAGPGDEDSLSEIGSACEWMNSFVSREVGRILDAGKIPGVVGGEHSVAFGGISAAAEHAGPLGVLQFDAHLDLRVAYEGFEWSHASVMRNVLQHAPGVERIVQVGIRDYGEREAEAARSSGGRVRCWFDADWHERRSNGEALNALVQGVIDELPEHVWVSFDIDGLDPSLCPHTGTPVPGGLGFNEARAILLALARSGRTIVGFDLVEVCPAPSGDSEWDANVGARILYSLCGAAAMSQSD